MPYLQLLGDSDLPPVSHDLPRIRAALLETNGIISRAATLLGVSKVHAMNLVKRFALREWARELRQRGGFPTTGRPPATLRASEEHQLRLAERLARKKGTQEQVAEKTVEELPIKIRPVVRKIRSMPLVAASAS